MEYGPLVILATSLLALPTMYYVSSAQEMHGEAALLIVGAVALFTICTINYIAIRYFANVSEPTWLLLAFVLGTFASAVDITLALEADGLVHGMMMMYLREGEPYLGTPHGTLINYWDGMAHYMLYAIMLCCIANKKDYRFVGLYWAGSIGHSMLVLIPAAVIGKFGVKWSVLLNIPYMFFPFMAAWRFLSLRPPHYTAPLTAPEPASNFAPSRKGRAKISEIARMGDNKMIIKGSGVLSRALDLFFVVGLMLSLLIAAFRGFAVLGCTHDITRNYVKYYEPYLNDPVAFPRVQMLIYLFYFTPYYIMAIKSLLYNSPSDNAWLIDWSILMAGAAAQAQVPHLFAPFYSSTPVEHRIPAQSQSVFFIINIFLLVQPHLLAVRCLLKSNSKHRQSHSRVDGSIDTKKKL